MRTGALIVLIVGVASLVMLFLWMRPDSPRIQPAQETSSEVLVEKDLPQEKEIRIELAGGQRVAGPEVIRVVQGEKLLLVITSQEDAELHLHGYDHRLLLKADVPYRHTFVAEHSGRFEYELHGHHAHHALGVLEVMPK